MEGRPALVKTRVSRISCGVESSECEARTKSILFGAAPSGTNAWAASAKNGEAASRLPPRKNLRSFSSGQDYGHKRFDCRDGTGY